MDLKENKRGDDNMVRVFGVEIGDIKEPKDESKKGVYRVGGRLVELGEDIGESKYFEACKLRYEELTGRELKQYDELGQSKGLSGAELYIRACCEELKQDEENGGVD